MTMRTRRTRTTKARTSTTRAKTTDVSKSYDPNLEAQGYSEKGTRRGKTQTVIDGNCEDEDDDIFLSSLPHKSKNDWKHPLRADDTAVAATLHRHRGERSHLRHRRETAPPTRCNLLPPRLWKLEYGAIAKYPHSLVFHPLAHCLIIPVEQTYLATFNLMDNQKHSPK